MKLIRSSHTCNLYQLGESPRVLVASTPESRAICNKPLIYGVAYTKLLEKACTRVLGQLQLDLKEAETSVVHLLRGGLNFGLRNALAEAYNWNGHGSCFLSAQRRRKSSNCEDWEIGESDYQKFTIPDTVSLVFGDVVASGASLRHGLETMVRAVNEKGSRLRSILFFTIGGARTESMFHEIEAAIRAQNPDYEGSTIVYLEGRFPVACRETSLKIKVTGTDLLRHGEALAPEFLESQYENPMFPVERCTIYDAGSRAFEPKCYLEDVLEYWEELLVFHEVSFTDYLSERCPALDPNRFGQVHLQELAQQQVHSLETELKLYG